ncbi:MAG: RpoL/Rpb11 RNA polymerase subunit family protein [Candidatus Micrarchaeota archaeon]
MKVEFIKDEKDEIKIKLMGEDKAICALVVEKLAGDKEVEFAGCNDDHPLLGNPVLIVKGKSPKKHLTDAIDEVKKELKDLEKTVEKL